MSKTLSFSKDRVRVLVSSELEAVAGGAAAVPTKTAAPGGFVKPTETAGKGKVIHHHKQHVSSQAPSNISSAPPATFITPLGW